MLNVFNVAAKLCELSAWQASHLTIQKATYIAQMLYLGQNDGVPLFNDDFEAWDRGPVCNDLYSKIKDAGDRIEKNIIPKGILPLAPEKNMKKYEKHLLGIHNIIMKYRPYQLVNMTHWEKGAWAKWYDPQEIHRIIPKNDIWQEYKTRLETR